MKRKRPCAECGADFVPKHNAKREEVKTLCGKCRKRFTANIELKGGRR